MENRVFEAEIGRNMEVYMDDMLVKSKKTEKHLDDLEETLNTLGRYQMKLNLVKCVFMVLTGKFLGSIISYRGIEANLKKIRSILDLKPPHTTKEVQWLAGWVAALNEKAD